MQLVLATFLAGCVAPGSAVETIYSSYRAYKEASNQQNIIEIAPSFFGSNLLGDDYRSDPYVADFLLFKQSMSREVSHYEKALAHRGCLTINGYNENNELVIFSLEYSLLGDKWLISTIHIIYDEKQPFDRALCPDEYGAG